MCRFCFLIFFFISLSLNSFCQLKIEDGHKKFFYENGNVSSEGLIKNGKPEGYWYTYYPNGIIKSEGNRKNFLLDSTWIFYAENGDLKSKINYKKGLKIGVKVYYSDSCNIVKEENFYNDVRHGYSYLYYDLPGKIKKQEIYFDQGKEEGKGYEFSGEDGRIITVLNYKKGTFVGKESINRKDKKGKKKGVWKKFYDSGKLKEECRYKNDLLNGYFKTYDKTGKLLEAILYINGVPQTFAEEIDVVDIKREFYADASVKKEGAYDSNGKEHGAFKYFNKEGKIEKTEVYHHGILLLRGRVDELDKRQGLWEEFYFDGTLKSKGEYKDGKKIGEWLFYFNSGELEQKGTFLEGELETGTWIWYHENGQILREENFRKGKEDGMMYEYDEEGTLITKGDFIDGLKEGEWFYELGDHREEGEYREGVRHGYWYFYYNNSDKINFEGKFTDGEPDGKHKYYYPSGKLWKEEFYTMGVKEENWKTYNELGETVLTIYFKDGQEYKIDGAKVN